MQGNSGKADKEHRKQVLKVATILWNQQVQIAGTIPNNKSDFII